MHARVGLGVLGVARRLVVARAAREVGALRVLDAGQRAVRDAVAVDVAVALELRQLRERRRRRAPCRGPTACSGYGNGSLIQLFMPRSRSREHEHRRLQPLGQVERRACRTRSSRAPSRAAAPGGCVSPCDSACDEREVALRGARRQAGARADALDVPDHRRDLGVVAVARRTRSSARCRGPRSRSSRARRPSPRPAPCRSRRSRPRPGPPRRWPCRSRDRAR